MQLEKLVRPNKQWQAQPNKSQPSSIKVPAYLPKAKHMRKQTAHAPTRLTGRVVGAEVAASFLALGSNPALKPTRILRAAYLVR